VNIAGEMQALMVTLDVKRAREVWKLVAPHLRQPESDEEMLTTLHLARTESPIVNTKLRYYSHCWRPAAEREYPRKVQGVGISVNARSDLFRPVTGLVRESMEEAVLEVYADGGADNVDLIKRRMNEARRNTVRKLLGIKE
jgi:hypothetical protein